MADTFGGTLDEARDRVEWAWDSWERGKYGMVVADLQAAIARLEQAKDWAHAAVARGTNPAKAEREGELK